MSDRTSHRRRARQHRVKAQKAAAREDQSVTCPQCGWPSLSYECFTECRDNRGRRKVALMTDVPNWEHMDMTELSGELDKRNADVIWIGRGRR